MGHICIAACTPSPPVGALGEASLRLPPAGTKFRREAERGGVRWGMLGAGGETHLTLPPLRVGPLPLPPEGRRGNLWQGRGIPAPGQR
jgi:hypothetical protein